MRTCTNKDDLLPNQILAIFIKDHNYNNYTGTVIQCESCNNVMVHWDDTTHSYYECDHCSKEILYPGWAEW